MRRHNIISNIVFSFVLFLFTFHGYSQSLYSLNTTWDDDIKEWSLYLNEGEIEGEIAMTWRLRNDPTEWTYKIEGVRGTIKQKWDNNPNVWELRSGSTIISVSTIWTSDFSSFKISDGDLTLRIQRKHNLSDPIEWEIQEERYGIFKWYNEYEYDIRDWIIIDELIQDIPLEFKIAAVFVSILQSTR